VDAVAISLHLLEQTRAEPDLRRLARDYVSKGRGLLFERHRAGAGGLEVAAAWSTVMDHLVRHLFTIVSAACTDRFAQANPRFALIAQGGYATLFSNS
jgi:hypothetical protein